MTLKEKDKILHADEYKRAKRLRALVMTMLEIVFMVAFAATLIGVAGLDGNTKLSGAMLIIGFLVTVASGWLMNMMVSEGKDSEDVD